MTDQRVGRHVRIYEWDEVDIEEDTTSSAVPAQETKVALTDKKTASEQPKRLSALLKKKLF